MKKEKTKVKNQKVLEKEEQVSKKDIRLEQETVNIEKEELLEKKKLAAKIDEILEQEKVKQDNLEKQEKKAAKKEDMFQKIANRKKVPKEVSQEIVKKIFKNLILAIVVMIYFIASNILYTQLELDKMEIITKTFSGVFLVASIILLEIAYKKDSGTLTLTAIELLILSIHALFIHHVITIYNFDFRAYLLTSSYVFAIYYVLKSIIIYTRARIKYVKSLSDIPEIIKDEPIVKEAKKREDKEEIKVSKKNIEDKKESKPKSMRGKNRKKGISKDLKDVDIEEKNKENKKSIPLEEDIIKEEKIEKKTRKKKVNKKKEEIEENIEEKEKENESKEMGILYFNGSNECQSGSLFVFRRGFRQRQHHRTDRGGGVLQREP